MNPRLFVPVYALTLLISAALLFSVQPMFSKLILPLLGGTPQVWNTAMLFFQLCLLGGYAYAHGMSRFLSMKAQALVHVALLLLFLLVLPFGIPEGWSPPRDHDPTIWQLSLMAMTVGGPFFILAGSAPMLQRWFSLSGHKDADNPYFLYGASNLGSLSALLAYPVIIEPLLNLPDQAMAWKYGYIALMAFTVFAALAVWTSVPKEKFSTLKNTLVQAISWKLRAHWLLLAFIPSSLMLGVTMFITTDIATVPLLWIMPLALYVGSFILAFAKKPLMSSKQLAFVFALSLIALMGLKVAFNYISLNPALLISLHLTVFFLAALLCHSELAKAKPDASRLTEFYLFMSLGGALGGFFNAIIAPQLLLIPIEYGLMLAAAAFMRFSNEPEHSLKNMIAHLKRQNSDLFFGLSAFMVYVIIIVAYFNFNMAQSILAATSATIIGGCLLLLAHTRWTFALMIAFLLATFPLGFFWGQNLFKKIIYQDRNFFGVAKVIDMQANERVLLHGTTNHGAQSQNEKFRLTPLSYYSEKSPLNDAMLYFNRKSGPQNVGVIGLGIGVTACFAKQGRHYDFFEIDPEIAAIAENKDLFTFLSDCKSPYEIILGDGRLTIAEKPEKHYDFIIIDAFSSDNIPVHLLTTEALSLYMQKLKDGGAIVMNISNNFLDLEPVLAENAKALDVLSYSHINVGGKFEGTDISYYPSHWMVLTKSKTFGTFLEDKGWTEGIFREGVKPWSDQYSNILSVLGDRSGSIRYGIIMNTQKKK
jgi:hypothetical protein